MARRRWLLAAAVLAAAGIGLLLAALGWGPAGGGGGVASTPPPLPSWLEGKPRVIRVASPAFEEGGVIPSRYTCDGEDVSPELLIEGVPGGARSIAVYVYDPDAPMGWFTHWTLYDVRPGVGRIPEAVPPRPVVEGLGLQGLNDFGRVGYGGPCPPPGHGRHRYVFLVLALDTPRLQLPPGASPGEFVEAVRGHVVAYGYTYGVYSR